LPISDYWATRENAPAVPQFSCSMTARRKRSLETSIVSMCQRALVLPIFALDLWRDASHEFEQEQYCYLAFYFIWRSFMTGFDFIDL
jgi:hypothetical protein